jgi:hypothetical protein
MHQSGKEFFTLSAVQDGITTISDGELTNIIETLDNSIHENSSRKEDFYGIGRGGRIGFM